MIEWRVFDVTEGKRVWRSTFTGPTIFPVWHTARQMFPRRVLVCDPVTNDGSIPRYRIAGRGNDGQRWLVFHRTYANPGHPDYAEALIGEAWAPDADSAERIARQSIPTVPGMQFSRVQSFASFRAA